LAALKTPARGDTTSRGKPAVSATADAAKPAQTDKTGNALPAPQTLPGNMQVAAKTSALSNAIAAADNGNTSTSAPQTGADASPPAAQPQPPAAPPTPPNPAPLSFAAVPVQGLDNAQAAGNGVPTASLHLTAAATPDIDGLAVQIAARSQSGAKQFDIRLDPPELGRVEVRLSIDASGKASAHMTADQPNTLTLLQKDSGSLTQALRDAGLDVARDGLNFSLRGQDSQNGSRNGGQNDNAGRRTTLSASHVIDSIQTASSLSLTGAAANASLDIQV
jgi:flagellar hook-length control protein FliK